MKATKILAILLLALVIGGVFLGGYAYAADFKIAPKAKEFRWNFLTAYGGLIFLLWGAGLAAHWLLLASFPNRTERLTTLSERSPWKSLLIGLVNLFVIIILVSATEKSAPPLCMMLSLIFGIALFVGLHGRCRALGRKILRAAKHEPSAFAEITVGWSTVAFLCAIPLLGWFVLAPFYLGGGLGALTLSFFKKPAASGGGVDLDSHQL
jgi:hypothetical protein